MLKRLLQTHFDVGDIKTPFGRAIVEERYWSLRRQVPIIYLLAVVDLCGLELATTGKLELGLNFPTLLGFFALARTAQWLRGSSTVSHEVMHRRLKQTNLFSGIICLLVSVWCVHLLGGEDRAGQMAVVLFGGLTAIGAAYGLSALPSAARLPLLVLALPLAGSAMVSNDPRFIGAAVSLAVVALLLLRLLSVHNSHFTGVIRSRSVIAEQQELAEHARQEAVVAATTDFLTGLPNRRAFIAALEAAILNNASFAVGIVDLDRFKAVNDTFGHASGDSLLKIAAERLRTAAGRNAVVARLGGDEFGLVLPGLDVPEHAKAIGERITAEVSRPIELHGRHLAISASCGFVISEEFSSATPSRLLADADLALYEAKRQSGGVALFEASMEAPYRRRAQVESALRLPGIQSNIRLVFQPIVDLQTGRVLANEALARWTDKELGEVRPSEFIPIAEQLNVIGDISNHLMAMAFAEAVHWPPSVRLSFNLSAVQLCTDRSAEAVLEALRKAGLETSRLQVEVTETALLADFERARENLDTLRSAGVIVILDDFGAGYASIAYLRQMRFDQIKLDGALVTAAQDNPDGKRLLGAVIGLCQALGVSTVAEHIESEQQFQLLLQLGCSAGQGFWLQSPLLPHEARALSCLGSPSGKASRSRTSRAA